MQTLRILLASLAGTREGDSVEFDAASGLASLSSHLRGLLSEEEG